MSRLYIIRKLNKRGKMKTTSLGDKHTKNLFDRFAPPTNTTKTVPMAKMSCKKKPRKKTKTMAAKKS